jgi:hypothetical protein
MSVKINLLLFSIAFSAHSYAGGLTDCEYYKTSVIKINNTTGASCNETKLCNAEILCTNTLPSKKKIDVTRNIICALDKDGICPSVEVCRADTTSVTYEKEAQVGSVGKTEWTTAMIKLTPIILESYSRSKSGLPLDPALDKMKDIKELKHNDESRK